MLSQSLELKLGQRLTMTPALQQAIKLLQLSKAELDQEIQSLLDSNIMLEREHNNDTLSDEAGDETPETAEDTGSTLEELATSPEEDYDWGDVYTAETKQTGSSSDDFDRVANISTDNSLSLHDHLEQQLQLLRLSQRDHWLCRHLIRYIDERGYLESPLGEILTDIDSCLPAEDRLDIGELELAKKQLQQLEPSGVCATDTAECLLLQLKATATETGLAEALLQRHQDTLANANLKQLSKVSGASETELQLALAQIRQLNPAPGLALKTTDEHYIDPEIAIRLRHGIWVAELGDSSAQALQINQQYAALAADKNSDPMLKQHLQEARWFIKSVQGRNDTLLNVANSIVARQQDFFFQGNVGLKPMVLKDIANDLDLHESTISRVTSSKYMLTPSGTLAFKHFFSSHVATSDGGEASAIAIQAMLKELVASEPAHKPLSDTALVKALANKDIKIARRTVAKYREAAKIPPSHSRKRIEP